MRRASLWFPVGLLAALAIAVLGVWSYRLNAHNLALSNSLEAERQRRFADLGYHVEEIQALLGKGLVTGNMLQNMRYMADVSRHASSAVDAFTSLPLPANVSASTGKFLQQVGDFSLALLRNEASGRAMTERERTELARLRQESVNLSQHLNKIQTSQAQGTFRWNQPIKFSWSALMRGPANTGKPATQDQAPSSLVPGGWEQVTQSMEKLPTLIYDGPFSDHVDQTAPAMSGTPITREEAAQRVAAYFPAANRYRTVKVSDLGGNIPAYSFQLTPTNAQGDTHSVTVDITKNGGYVLQVLDGRMTGNPTLDLTRARVLGQEYLTNAGIPNMVPTYGQVEAGTATIAYAVREGGLLIYPDQIKVKVALDNGEILAVDTRQYLMHHRQRSLPTATLTANQAEEHVNPDLEIQRIQLTLIPDQAGTGEILAYEFLGKHGEETYLVYINADTGEEEQILQLIQSDGGTFTL